MKAPIAQPGAWPGNAPGFEIFVFIGIYGRKLIQNNSDCRWVSFSGYP
jgi:hypothetical protein